jgi:Pectate lyase superfamily protein
MMTIWLYALLLDWPLAAWAQPVFDATAYGAVADDDQDDTRAIRDAVNTANNAGGGVVQLPPGVLHVDRLPLTHQAGHRGAPALEKPLRGVTLQGMGAGGPQATTLVRRRLGSPDENRVLRLVDAQDVTLRDLAVNMNRLERFGGIVVRACRRCTFERLHLYDATPFPYDPQDDRYALVFGFGGAVHEDLTLRHLRVEDLQVEVDNARRVLIEDNWFIRGDFTAALGAFGLYGGGVFEDAVIARNRFVNAARQALTLQTHPPGNPTVFRTILVEDNVFVYDPTVRQAPGVAVRVGMHDTSVAIPGCVFADIAVQGNQIYLAPGVPHRDGPLLLGNVSDRSGWRWEGLTVRDNTLYTHTPRRFVAVRRVPGDTAEVADNVTLPYRTPPVAPWPAVGAPVP